MTGRSNGLGDRQALRDEIRQTRAELGETVEALAAKADVKARLKGSAAQTRRRVGQQAAQTRELVRERAGRNPVPLAVAALGAVAVVIVVLLRRRWRR
jgi:hypothetical protein